MALQTTHCLIAQNYAAIHLVPLNVVTVWSLHISIKEKETKSENGFMVLRESVSTPTAHISQRLPDSVGKIKFTFPPFFTNSDVNN